jgi:hypothetical protein
MEHVRIGQDQVGPLSDLPSLLTRRVAVVDRRLDPRRLEQRERADLVLRQRLGRVEVERAQLGLAREGVEDREVERERLAGRGARRDDQVLPAGSGLPGLGLMGEELRDPGRGESVADAGLEVVRKRFKPSDASGLRCEMRELLAGEQVVPFGDIDSYVADASLASPGCRSTRLRSHPLNLIRFVPAKGGEF